MMYVNRIVELVIHLARQGLGWPQLGNSALYINMSTALRPLRLNSALNFEIRSISHEMPDSCASSPELAEDMAEQLISHVQ